jgi:hypothetical protein
MHPLTPPLVSALPYLVQNEDYATELAVLAYLNLNRPLSVLTQKNNDATSFIWRMPGCAYRSVRNTPCVRMDALCTKCLWGIAHCTIDVRDLSILFRLGSITITTPTLCNAQTMSNIMRKRAVLPVKT